MNIILNTDSYKLSHYKLYPPGMTQMVSYIEAREGGKWNEVMFFGLQGFIKQYLLTPITREDIDEAEALALAHGEPFNKEGWEYILKEYDGYLPIIIEALPETMVAPTGTVLVQFTNTDVKCAWLVSYLETAMLRAIWYPSTVATNAMMCKRVIRKYLEDTGCTDIDGTIGFMLHDFGARGATSHESASIGSAAHQLSFMGTDTIEGIVYLQKYYGAEVESFSIPAMDHAAVISWGYSPEQEDAAFENALNQYLKFGKIVACVIDSYDIDRAVNTFCTKFKDKIVSSGGRVVIRPDSGDPVEHCTNIAKKLMDAYGYTENANGYRVLPNCVRVLFGDGIDIAAIDRILEKAMVNKIAAENFVFGMGGGLLQGINRDTLRFACKANACTVNNAIRDISKSTVGKSSKAGIQIVLDNPIRNVPAKVATKDELRENILQVVYFNGELKIDQKFVRPDV